MIKHFTDGKLLLSLWLGSAAAVTVLRFFHAADPSYDLGLQLEAAHNLLAGRGLSTYSELGPNLSDRNVLIPLTYFPAGYSLVAAALLAVGLGVGTTVNVLGAVATMLGWWGWGRLAQPFLGEGLKRPAWKWAGIVIAVSAPLLFTEPWGGTDIFLWAAVPWVVDCTVRASDEKAPKAWGFDWLAGTLCGLAVLMRYASFFLAAYVVCVVLWQARLRFWELLRRLSAFGIGLLPALVFQGYLNYFHTDLPATPGGLFDARVSVLAHLAAGIRSMPNANYLWAFWIPGKVASLLFPVRRGTFPLRSGLLVVAFALLLLAFETYRQVLLNATARDRRTVSLGLFPAVPFFLWGCMTLSSANFLGDLRYFWPVVPLSVFVAYSIASIADIPRKRSIGGLLRSVAALYLIGYVGMSLVYMLFVFMPGRIGHSQREKLMASTLERWPSMAVKYEYSSARQFVMGLLKKDPDALLVTSQGASFFWDRAVDESRLHLIYCDNSQPRYVDGPARILIFTFDEGEADQVWVYKGNSTLGYSARAACFESLPGRRVLRRFPDEGMKVLEASVGAGQRILLN